MTPARPCKTAAAPGFALLITITLVAFLVLILVALASLTRVETSVAGNSRMLGLARQNALFSLNLAVGRLQESAGPDDRLTARSEITAAGPAHQPYLTGVWERSNTNSTPDAWLVSGDPADPVDTGDVLDPATGSGVYEDGTSPWVFLVGDASVAEAAQRVRMATRAIEVPADTVPGILAAATLGRYAWWIGDEGVKASASLVDPLLLPDPISYNSGGATGDDWADAVKFARLNQLQPVRPRLERVFGGVSPDAATTAGQLARVSQFSQLGMVSGGPDAATRKAAFHAVTQLSEAVLVDHYDSAQIRLRRDLSDLGGGFHSGPSAGQQLSIRRYQQLRATVSDPDAPYDASFRPASSQTGTAFPLFHAGPVLTEFGLRCAFEIRGVNLFLLYWIDAEIWNPYSAGIETDAAAQLSLFIETDIEVVVRDNAGGVHSVNVSRVIREANGLTTGSRPVGVLIEAGETWRPGEVKLLSGGSTLSADSPVEGDIDTGRTVEAGAIRVESVDLPALERIALELRVNIPGSIPGRIQLQTPEKAFSATTAAHPDLADPAAPRYAFGYGYNLRNNFSRWQNTGSTSLDVRYPSLSGDIHATDGTARWSGNPADNAGQLPDELFINLPRLVFYDLPRQELVSVGDLRHLSAQKAFEIGNPHAAANNRWFDHYFFSTVPHGHAWDFAGGEPLPNRHVRHVRSERAVAALADLRDADNAARFLLQRGAFNLNSTSVDAWRMMLGQRLAGWRGISTEAEPAGTTDLENTFFRHTHGAQQLPVAPLETDAVTTNGAALTGGRRLTDPQISALATSIVQRLRARGRPFPSIHSLLSATGGGGLIRDALNDAGITPAGAAALPPAAVVSQADIVAQLAPVLTPRSDTFLIRAYGDARNPVTGDVEGRSWCEAIVQRVPDVTDPVSGTYAAGDEIQPSAAKYPFGRKFKIISFRWLSPDDI